MAARRILTAGAVSEYSILGGMSPAYNATAVSRVFERITPYSEVNQPSLHGTDHVGGRSRPLHRTRRQLHRYGQRVHQRPLREDHRRPHRPRSREARPASHRHQVQHKPLSRRSERRRLESQGSDRGLRAVTAPATDRLHRSLLVAQLGQTHAHRGDHGGIAGPRRVG